MNSLSVFCACWILRRGERERGHDIRLRSLREFLKVRFDYPITVLAWHALKPPIDYANPNGGRVVAISIDLLQDRPPENVIDQTSLISRRLVSQAGTMAFVMISGERKRGRSWDLLELLY